MSEYTTNEKWVGKINGTPFELNRSQTKSGLPPFIAAFREGLAYLSGLELSKPALRVCLKLLELCEAGNYIHVRYSELETKLQISRRAIYNSLEELKQADIIRGSRNQYMFNPLISFNGGKKRHMTSIRMYEKLSRCTDQVNQCTTVHLGNLEKSSS